MYQTVIFDVDGTLIDTERAVLGSLQKMLKKDYSQDFELEELSFVLGIPGSKSLPQLGISDIESANEKWNFYMKEFFDTIEVFPGITELMISLKNKEIIQGIVTSKTNEELKNDFVPFGLMKYLSFIVCADDTEKHKPNPEPLLKFMEISNTQPSKAIYIGDTIYDFECATAAGIDFGLALWGCKTPDKIKATYTFSSPDELIRLLI